MSKPFPNPQRGAALLLLLLVAIAAAASVVVAQMSGARLRMQRTDNTQQALATAKQALVDYAASYSDRFPGEPLQLPCPDLDASGGLLDGEAHTAACGPAGVAVIGRLPWRTLGIDAPKDADGNCLWYAVSGSYKSAASATGAMINPDTNGQLQLVSTESAAVVVGGQPEDRAVAMVLAPNKPLSGQTRSIAGAAGLCRSDFAVGNYLDAAAATGISNASLSGLAFGIESFATAQSNGAAPNDGLLSVSRRELAAAVQERHDFDGAMALLTEGLASCVAAYGLQNPGGGTDLRLPWPAPVGLADYADDPSYNDGNGSLLSGRLPDIVDDSSAQTGNTVARLLADCDTVLAPAWNANLLPLWQHWKDHIFYAVADAYQPTSSVPTQCGDCVSVDSTGVFAAIVMFSGPRLESLAQQRNAPPMDADTRQDIGNYLEGRNQSNHPYTAGTADFETRPVSSDFNDVAYCVDAALSVTPC